MPCFLGIDTSNYTTSAALYDPGKGMLHRKKLLPVKNGECGLRQSDAVFHHVRQLPEVMRELTADFTGDIDAIGVSVRPRDVQGSYMPCFTVGDAVAQILSDIHRIPVYEFSHQSGHIAAAVFSCGRADLFRQRFLAFHVSGGTTEAVLVSPDEEKIFTAELVGRTLDLNAGQLIDRIGVMLGMQFPCGAELEQTAMGYIGKPVRAKATIKETDCCLSGIENKCRQIFEETGSPEYTAAACLAYVEAAISGMCEKILGKYGSMPVLFAGGVMSDRIIRNELERKFGAFFAEPEFSADNAAGIAYMTALKSLRYNDNQ